MLKRGRNPEILLMQKVRQIKQLPVDLKALMDGLSSLLLPSQKPMFSQHMYALKGFSPENKLYNHLCYLFLLGLIF